MTIESFLAWKAKFEAETVKVKVVRDPTKPTGREMFLNNAALNESDIEFLTSGKILTKVKSSNPARRKIYEHNGSPCKKPLNQNLA